MREITMTELSRNLHELLNQVELAGEELLVVRNHHQIARIIPNTVRLTATEAMADLYQTLSDEAASGWLQDSRQPLGDHEQENSGQGTVDEMRAPWGS